MIVKLLIYTNRLSAISIAFVIAAMAYFPLPAKVFAQTSQGLNIEISPLPIELNAKPGSSASSDLRIRNSGIAPETLKLVLKTFSAEGSDGHIVLHDPSPGDDFIKWVSFDKDTFDAPAGQWQTIHMTVNLPKSAAFGYYYAVQVELANKPKAQPGTAKLQGAVAIFVLLNAEAPGAVKKAEVRLFSSDHHSFEFLPVNFGVQVFNSGNIHLRPRGNIFIKKGSKQVAALPINATEGVVLPKSNRVFTAYWDDGFPVYINKTDPSGQPIKDAKGNVKKQLKWDFSKSFNRLRFGHYTASLLLVYNDGARDVPVAGSLSFWVIPWRLIVVLVLVLALIAFFAIKYWLARREIKRLKGRRETKNE